MLLKYSSQRVAYPYFVIALLLFLLQIVVGIWLALSYAVTIPQGLVDILPFSTTRAIHTNLLVLWLLLGFMGTTYFMVPEEAEREIYSPALAYVQLILLVAVGVVALIGFVFGWTKGKPLLEIPFPLDYLVVVGALIFLFNVGMTILRAKRWTIVQGSLFGGLVFLALMYLFNLPFYSNLAIDWYYWWWVIHLWVEGAWELIAAALTAWILIKITKSRESSWRNGFMSSSVSFSSPGSPAPAITTTGWGRPATGCGWAASSALWNRYRFCS
jgi:nitric oxide reductase subunit B